MEEDLTDVAVRLDDYIWLKLSIVRHNPDQRYVVDYVTYFGFQRLIHEQYGMFYIICLNNKFYPFIRFL